MKTIRKPASYFRQLCTALSYLFIMVLVCLAAVLMFLIATSTAHSQTPPVNTGTAVYPAGGNIATALTATSATLTPGLLAAGGCASNTTTVTGAATSMAVSVSPVTYPGDGSVFFGYVSSANTVTVKVCAILLSTPGATAYNIRVIQ